MRTRKRENNDLYRTPIDAVLLVKDRFDFSNSWEPCAGDGRISKTLNVKKATDINPLADSIDYLDFFETTKQDAIGIDLIVTNPPFSKIKEFIKHSLSLDLPCLVLIPEEKIAGNKSKDLQDHVHWRGTVSDLIKFDTIDGRIVNGNGTMRCAWFLFKPEKSGGKFTSEYMHFLKNRC
jgi:hypothetical protein